MGPGDRRGGGPESPYLGEFSPWLAARRPPGSERGVFQRLAEMMRLAICFRGTTRAAAPQPYRGFIFNTRTLFSVGIPVPTGFAEDVHGRCCKGCQRPAGRGITRLEKGGNKSLLEKTPGSVSTCPRPAPGKTRTPQGGRTLGFPPSALFPYRESDGGAPFVYKRMDPFSGTDVLSSLVHLYRDYCRSDESFP